MYTWENNVRVKTSAPLVPGDVSIIVSAGQPPFNTPPAATTTNPGVLTILDNLSSPTKVETITYTGRTDNGNNTWTLTGVSRAQENTSAQSWVTNSWVIQGVTKGAFTQIDTDAQAKVDAHAALAAPHTGHVLSSDYTANDVLSKLITVDGAGSGLDADLLDGQDSTLFVKKTGTTFTGQVFIEHNSVPLVLTEADQTDPVGRWRIVTEGGNFRIDRSTSAGFASAEVSFKINSDGTISLANSITQEAWIAPTLLNGWVYFGSPHNTPGYYKDKQNRVYLRGMIKNGTVGLPAFNLAVGYRPAAQELLVTISSGTTSRGRIDIHTNGDVIPVLPSDNGWVSLDGLSFRIL